MSSGTREYTRTHPWIKFLVDLRACPHDLWIMLGECQSKIEHLAGVPLRPNTAKKLQNLYLAKGVRATTAIEGNTLTEAQVLDAVNHTLKLPPSQQYLQQEVNNIIDACNTLLATAMVSTTASCSVEKIRAFNVSVLKGLKVEEHVVPGEYSSTGLTVGRYRAAPRRDTEYLVEKLCEWLNGNAFAPSGELQTGMAILKAILAHLYIAWIHPFGDGNGRTARLIEFEILLHAGVPAPAAHLLSNHYNLTREEYYRQLDLTSKSNGDIIPFISYAVQGLRDGLRDQIQYVRTEQRDVVWRNFVHEKFRDLNTAADIRRRHLVLDLSMQEAGVPRSALQTVSTRIATAYARKGEKTLSRDLNELKAMELVLRTPALSGHEKSKWIWSANKSLIDAFLPVRRSNNSESAEPKAPKRTRNSLAAR